MKAMLFVGCLCWLVGLTAQVNTDPAVTNYKTTVSSVVLVEASLEVEILGIFDLLPALPGKQKPVITRQKRIIHVTGTAFAVGDGHTLVTAYHVVEGAVGDITLTEKNGHSQTGKVVKIDKEADLALIYVTKPLPPLSLADSVSPLERVYMVGNPGPMRFVEVEGRVIGFDGREMVYDITCYFGFSGSALQNSDGEVIGVAHKMNTRQPRLTFGGTLDELRRFLKS